MNLNQIGLQRLCGNASSYVLIANLSAQAACQLAGCSRRCPGSRAAPAQLPPWRARASLDALALAFINSGAQGAGQGGWFCGGRLQRCGCGWRQWRGCGWPSASRSSKGASSVTMALRSAPWLRALSAARLMTCSSFADVARPVVARRASYYAGRQGAGCECPSPCAVELEKAPPAAARRRHARAVAVSAPGRPTGGGTGRRGTGHWPLRSRRLRLVAAITHVHAPGLVGAQALDFAVLQGAQQQPARSASARPLRPGTRCRRRPPPKQPGRSLTAPENAPRRWPNNSLGQRFRAARRSSTMYQRLVAARRVAVQQARKQLLAHAGLAQQQHRQVGARHHLHLVQQAREHIALADDLQVAQCGRHGAHPAGRRRGVQPGRGFPAPGARCAAPFPPAPCIAGSAVRAAASKVPVCSASSVSTPQGWPSMRRPTPMQSCTGRVTHQGVEQAVVRVGQLAVVVEAGDLAAGQDAARPGAWPTANRRPSAPPTSPSTATGRRWSSSRRSKTTPPQRNCARSQPTRRCRRTACGLLGHQVGEKRLRQGGTITISRYFLNHERGW